MIGNAPSAGFASLPRLLHATLPALDMGFQYNTALREQREEALRAVAAARDAQLRTLAYQLNPNFLLMTIQQGIYAGPAQSAIVRLPTRDARHASQCA